MQGWKTVIVAGALVLVGFLQSLDWVSLIPNDPKTVGWIVSAIGIVMGALRAASSTPVFKSSPPAGGQ